MITTYRGKTKPLIEPVGQSAALFCPYGLGNTFSIDLKLPVINHQQSGKHDTQDDY